MVPKYAEGWGDTRGNTPGMDILTTGEEFVPRLVVGYEGEVWGKAPCGTYLPTEEYPQTCPYNPEPSLVQIPSQFYFHPRDVPPLYLPYPSTYFGTIFSPPNW